jgi:hypothetical protein
MQVRFGLVLLVGLLSFSAAAAETPSSLSGLSPRSDQAYTRYELLAPGSGKFRILYDVTETHAGAKLFFNPIRKGSVVSDETVTDLASGDPLTFRVVSGAEAESIGFADADTTSDYIRVELSRPAPADGGEARIHAGGLSPGRIDAYHRDVENLINRRCMSVGTRYLMNYFGRARPIRQHKPFGGDLLAEMLA